MNVKVILGEIARILAIFQPSDGRELRLIPTLKASDGLLLITIQLVDVGYESTEAFFTSVINLHCEICNYDVCRDKNDIHCIGKSLNDLYKAIESFALMN